MYSLLWTLLYLKKQSKKFLQFYSYSCAASTRKLGYNFSLYPSFFFTSGYKLGQ